MKASDLVTLLQSSIKYHGDNQVTVDVVDAGWHRLKNVTSVSVEEIEGNNFAIINHE